MEETLLAKEIRKWTLKDDKEAPGTADGADPAIQVNSGDLGSGCVWCLHPMLKGAGKCLKGRGPAAPAFAFKAGRKRRGNITFSEAA